MGGRFFADYFGAVMPGPGPDSHRVCAVEAVFRCYGLRKRGSEALYRRKIVEHRARRPLVKGNRQGKGSVDAARVNLLTRSNLEARS